MVQAIALAVSETVTNAIVHAYDREGEGPVRVSCRSDGERFIVEVVDEGGGITSLPHSPGIGQGLALVGALSQRLDIAPGPNGRGTTVIMAFGEAQPLTAPPGLEVLCALALETVADVSCVDVAGEGVLRRVAAKVADDAELTEWLSEALPPARPGTATWAALREGTVSLVVHDPTVPRSPGGIGEHLGLAWWLAVPLRAGAALWGLGGRVAGRPVPPEEVVGIFAEAAGRDLVHPAEQALLRAQLAAASR